jgi:hypothetical protein
VGLEHEEAAHQVQSGDIVVSHLREGAGETSEVAKGSGGEGGDESGMSTAA